MLSTEEFRTFARGVVPFLHVTSRIEGEKYGGLMGEKGGPGFPFVVAMDAEGVVHAESDEDTVEGFRALMKRGVEFVALAAKKDRTPDEERRLLRQEMRFRRVGAADARRRIAGLKGASDAETKELDNILLSLEIKAELDKIVRRDAGLRIAAGKALAALWKEGREPAPNTFEFQPFFFLILDFAESGKDVPLYEKALARVRAKYEGAPHGPGLLEVLEQRLAKMKEAAPPPVPGGGERKEGK